MHNIANMGEITAVSRASLHTVIPMSIIKQWKLKEGAKIDWKYEVLKGEMVLVVKKADLSILQTGSYIITKLTKN